ncbi:MAG: hypothetical protein K8L99_24035 [Anaerolineae bacterium]|nr:hypothetical protein [Anaerolineae bacterium]
MKQVYLRLLGVVFLLLLGTEMGSKALFAQQAPVPPDVQVLCPHGLKSGIPFAWLRFEPSSAAGFSVTLRPGETVQLNNPPMLVWDNVQWWVYVWPNASPAKGYYWVELGSLEPRCQQPTPPASGKAPWQPGNHVQVKSNISFVWFRAAPAPGNPPIHTVFPGTQLVIVQGASSDNYNQWWWLMQDPAAGVTGWVEQNSVELVTSPPPTIPAGSWRPGDRVRVRSSIPFSWLRSTPSSNGGILFTVQPLQELLIRQGPQHDGVQNWWQVTVPNTSQTGWVEEVSLELVRRGA